MRRATLDTNVPLELWLDQENKVVVAELVRLAGAGEIELAISRRFDDDVRDETAARLSELPVVRTGVVFTIGESTLGGHDFLGSQGFVDFRDSDDFSEIERALIEERKLDPKGRRGPRPPDERDWGHLHAHLCQDRDVFVTWDRGIHAWADALRARFGIIVRTPEEFLDEVRAEEDEDDVAS